jgi:Transposase DDE domain group 1
MRSSHAVTAVSASLSDPNLIAHAGLAPALRLAERCGLGELAGSHLTVSSPNAAVKVTSIVAGMLAGADSIDDLGVLRHGGMDRLFHDMRAPSTLGTFLRAFTHGHVRQLHAVARRFTAALAAAAPLLPGAHALAFVDVDSKVKQVHGYAKQGAAFGYTKVRGLHFQTAAVSTPLAAPVIMATRLRKGSAGSGKGAASLFTEAIGAAREAGATGTIIARADSAFFSAKTIAAIRRAGARFSITVPGSKTVRAAIGTIDEGAWQAIKYPNALYDEASGEWISDAQITEIPFTAFTSKGKKWQVTARLIVRRVKRPPNAGDGQGELFPTWRYHAVFTDSGITLVQAEAGHRGHAIIEQVFADLNDSALAHMPSGSFQANAAWLALAAVAYNLTRAAGTLASAFHSKARTGTIRRTLINIPARLASSARRLHLHLPARWPWAHAWENLWTGTGHQLRT